MNDGSTRAICRHCSRFNPGSPVCRWCGVNDPYDLDAPTKVFAPQGRRTQAERTRAREALLGPVPKGRVEQYRYWDAVKAAEKAGQL